MRRRALDLLARREHSRAELRAKLRSRGFDAQAVDAVLATLQGEGLQSDARFAESYLRARVERGMGPVRLRAELGARGLERGDIERAVGALDVDWYELAAQARRRRFGDAPPLNFKEKGRQSRFLAQRGFDGEQIRFALGDE